MRLERTRARRRRNRRTPFVARRVLHRVGACRDLVLGLRSRGGIVRLTGRTALRPGGLGTRGAGSSDVAVVQYGVVGGVRVLDVGVVYGGVAVAGAVDGDVVDHRLIDIGVVDVGH